MGSGQSRQTRATSLRASVLHSSPDAGSKMFFVSPADTHGKQTKKDDNVLLEVSMVGFRILRLDTRDPLAAYPWSQIHSWKHLPSQFSFRFYDERCKEVVERCFQTEDPLELLKHIQLTISAILADRREHTIPAQSYQDLLGMLQHGDADLRLQHVQTSASMNFFTAAQAQGLVALLANSFDKVEAARILHSRLMDQSNYGRVLEALDCDADRENVWVRISNMKRESSVICGPSRTASLPAQAGQLAPATSSHQPSVGLSPVLSEE